MEVPLIGEPGIPGPWCGRKVGGLEGIGFRKGHPALLRQGICQLQRGIIAQIGRADTPHIPRIVYHRAVELLAQLPPRPVREAIRKLHKDIVGEKKFEAVLVDEGTAGALHVGVAAYFVQLFSIPPDYQPVGWNPGLNGNPARSGKPGRHDPKMRGFRRDDQPGGKDPPQRPLFTLYDVIIHPFLRHDSLLWL
jgi:hypothetical protein